MSTRPLRISCLADAASPHVQRFVGYCVARGWEVEILSFQQGAVRGAHVHELKSRRRSVGGGNWHLTLHLPRVIRALRRLRPDLVIAHYITSYGFLAACSAGSIPVALWGYGSDLLVSPSRSWFARTAGRYALRRCGALIVVSPQLAEAAATLWPPVAARTLVMPFGVDPERFHPRGRRDGEVGPRCVALRGFMPNSQPLLVLETFEQLVARHPGATLVMTGQGPLLAAVEQALQRSRYRDRVQLVGVVDGERVPELLRAADLYVGPTFSDGTSVSLLEAMACGVCPVVSDIPANRWWIERGVNGILVLPDAPASVWAKQLSHAWENARWRNDAAQHNTRAIAERGQLSGNLDRAFKFVFSAVWGNPSATVS